MCCIVLDLEWNQPFSMRSMITTPVRLHGEIIQIGAVKLNEQLEIVDTFKVMVKPKYYPYMHRKISRLTQISNADLAYGFPFKQAFAYFTAWCPEDAVFLTWGNEDFKVLYSNISVHKIKGYHLPKAYDVQRAFSRQIVKERRQYSLIQAMDMIQEPACTAHDALHDAMNTVQVLRHLDLPSLLNDDHPDIPYSQENGLQEMNEDLFDTKTEAFAAMMRRAWICPECSHPVVFDNWISQNSDKQIATAACDCGCAYFARIHIRKNADKYRCHRIVYPLTDAHISFYNERKDIVRYKAERHAEYEAIRLQVHAC